MKHRTKIITIGLLAVVLMAAWVIVNQADSFDTPLFTKTTSQKEKQLAYLKEHEQEIVDFVKSQNPKVESVQIDWSQTQWSTGGHMFKTTHFISVYGGFNYLEHSGWGVDIQLREDGTVDMSTIGLVNGLRLGDDYFE